MEYRNLIIKKKGNIAEITLNRPHVQNALNEDLMAEIVNALKQSDCDSHVRVIMLKGAGDKAFSAGGDLEKLREKARENSISARKYTSNYANLMLVLREITKPVIAVVQGYALAGGFGLAVACDLTIASEKARLGSTEINIGFWGAMISAPIVRTVGLKKAMELFYTGRIIDGMEAERIGLVNKVVPHDRLEPEADALAETIASKSPLAIKMGREMFLNAQDMEYEKSIKYLREMATILVGSHDAYEGFTAFFEKRQPKWLGE